jgi:lipid-binding SYLF domain-containing protein
VVLLSDLNTHFLPTGTAGRVLLVVADRMLPSQAMKLNPGSKRLKNIKGREFMSMKNCIWILAIAGSMSTAVFAADRAIKVEDRLNASADTLVDMMRASDHGIPQDLIDKARCVVVIPGMKKAGFIFGAEGGRGFAACRREGGTAWSAPAAMRSEGGSFGFQIGASETDVVLLIMNQGGMRHLLSDKFTVGGDASVAGGPVGRDASARTDAMMNAEILSYSRSRGLFAGIALTGVTLRADGETNRELYGRESTNHEILTGDFKTPAVARKFEHALNRESPQRNP